MKKLVLLLSLVFIALASTGCQVTDPSHRDTFILVSGIAQNHLEFEQAISLVECEEDGTPAEDCTDALAFERWAAVVGTFHQKLIDADTIVIGAEEIDLIVDALVAEMGGHVDHRTLVYIKDIKIVLKMMLRDNEARMTMRAIPVE